MIESISERQTNREDLLHDLIQIVEETVADWETGWEGRINADTYLVADLGFHSVDIITLAVRIEEHFHRQGIPFQQLLMTPEGRYVDDLNVGQLADFLTAYFNETAPQDAGQQHG